MKILTSTLFLIFTIFPEPGDLKFRSSFRRQKPLEVYTRFYQICSDSIQLIKTQRGQHKVAVDGTGRFVIGYAEEARNPDYKNTYILFPFVEEVPVHSNPQRIKIRIIGNSATSYMAILPNDPLNDLFFKPISRERLRDVKAIPNPAEQSAVA